MTQLATTFARTARKVARRLHAHAAACALQPRRGSSARASEAVARRRVPIAPTGLLCAAVAAGLALAIQPGPAAAQAGEPPAELLDIAGRIAGAVNEHGLSSFPDVEYPLYIAQEATPEAVRVESAQGFPPPGESFRLSATNVRARLMPAAAVLLFDVEGHGMAVPCVAFLARSGVPAEPGALPSYVVCALAVGVPGDVHTEATAELRVLAQRFDEAYTEGQIHDFPGVCVPLPLVNGDDGTTTELTTLPGAPLAEHGAGPEELCAVESGGVALVHFLLPRDGGPVAVGLLASFVEGRWRTVAACVGRSASPLLSDGAPAPDEVLVDGKPPLLAHHVADVTALYEFVLNTHLSHEDRVALRDALVADFTVASEEQRGALLTLASWWGEVDAIAPEERWALRRMMLEDLLAGARERPDLATAGLLLDWSARGITVLVAGNPPLTLDAAESYAHLLAAAGSLVAEDSLRAPEGDIEDLVAELTRAYPRMGEEEQRIISGAPRAWDLLQMMWRAAPEEDRRALAAGLAREAVASARRTRTGGAYIPDLLRADTEAPAVKDRLREMFPPEPEPGGPPVDIGHEIEAAEEQGEGALAAMLSQTRHELAQELVRRLEPLAGGTGPGLAPRGGAAPGEGDDDRPPARAGRTP
jgi:hypothetical protein